MKKYPLILVLVVILSLAGAGVASASPPLQGGGNLHQVAYGETLYSIAGRYGVSVEAILMTNGLSNPNMIYIGQQLAVPGAPAGGYYAPKYGVGPACASYHTVAPGETLSGISYQYGIPVQNMMTYNNMYNGDMVYAGQKVCMPGGAGPAVQPAGYGAPSNGYHHTVIYGETLHSIANRYGVNYYEIMKANNLGNASWIVTGQVLFIPGYYPAPLPIQPSVPVEELVIVPEYHAPPVVPVVPPHPPVHKVVPSVIDTSTPDAPDYQASPVKPLLPTANTPIEVVVNGGSVWVGEVYPNFPDPDGDTVLIVSTRESDKPTVIMRSGDYEVKGQLGLVPEFGIDQYRFAFRYIPPGDYDVWFEDPEGTPSEKAQVTVEGGKRVEVNFQKGIGFSGPTYASPDGWVLGEWTNPSEPGKNLGGWSNILIRTPASGLWVNIESEGGGYKAQCFTGSKGPGTCDFAGLTAGLYWISIDGTGLTLKTYMDGNAYAEFTFNRQPTESSENAVGPVSYSD